MWHGLAFLDKIKKLEIMRCGGQMTVFFYAKIVKISEGFYGRSHIEYYLDFK